MWWIFVCRSAVSSTCCLPWLRAPPSPSSRSRRCFVQKKHYNRILGTYPTRKAFLTGLPPPGCGQEIPLAREQDQQTSSISWQKRLKKEMSRLTQRRRQELMHLDKLQKQLVGLRSTSTCYMCRRVRTSAETRLLCLLFA